MLDVIPDALVFAKTRSLSGQIVIPGGDGSIPVCYNASSAVVTDASKQDARIVLTSPVIEGRLDDSAVRKEGESLRVRLTAVDVPAGRMTFSPA